MHTKFKQVLGGLTLAVSLLAPAHATVTYQIGSNTVSIPGLTGYATNGAMMDGLTVTAVFSRGLTETLSWSDIGPVSGAVFGSGWTLRLGGDTYGSNWRFSTLASARLGRLLSLTLDGRTGFTVFDRKEPQDGTNDSGPGGDWACQTLAVCNNATVTYDYAVSIGSAAPVGDLFQLITIDFGAAGPTANFAFRQDTDNDSGLIASVPEPASLALIGAALVAAAFRRRA